MILSMQYFYKVSMYTDMYSNSKYYPFFNLIFTLENVIKLDHVSTIGKHIL